MLKSLLRIPPLLALSSIAALALAVGGCAGEGSPTNDGGISEDGPSTGRDGSVRDARPGQDAEDLSMLGALITPLPANLIGVPEGGAEVLYVRGDGTLMRSAPDGTGATELGIKPTFGYGPSPNLWVWTGVDTDNALGTVNLYRPGDPRAVPLANLAAVDLFGTDEDGHRALAMVDAVTVGTGMTSTRTADLVFFDDQGGKRVLLRGISIGRWDRRIRRHVNSCTPLADFLSEPVAIVLACPAGATSRTAYFIDLVTGNTSTVAANVLSFLRVGKDRSFALLADDQRGFFGVGADGRVIDLPEQDRLESLAFLDGRRFAYTTSSGQLLIASWPTMLSTVALPAGAARIESASPTGEHLIFRQMSSMIGLRDLYSISTSTAASQTPLTLVAETDGYPGDDAFSEDGVWAQWFEDGDANYIGNPANRRVDGTGSAKVLGPRGYNIRNTVDPNKVLLMINTRFSEQTQRLVSDMATADRSGSGEPTLLVPGVDPVSFAVFEELDRVFYRIPEGPHAGLWVRTIP
jgi:hypothetical protein